MTGNEIRKNLIDARDIYIREIKNELLGPGSEFEVPDADHELISSSPTSRYSVGILFPQGNLVEQDNDETVPLESDEEVQAGALSPYQGGRHQGQQQAGEALQVVLY